MAKMGKDALKLMRERYERAVDADNDNRILSRSDIKFVTVQGNQWDESQRKARKGRPCYEFPILRSHWRQICNDQKQARPSVKVSGVEDDDKDGADLRQGLVRNIERCSNASKAYDVAFEEMTAGGFGAWRISTEYTDDDAFNQDIVISPLHDAVNRVWVDPDAREDSSEDAKFTFVEETISKAEFESRYPKATISDFEGNNVGDWFSKDSVRIAEYWRVENVPKRIVLLSDGKTLDGDEYDKIGDELAQQGITMDRERKIVGKKVIVSIVSGFEELEPAQETVFNRIPIITVYGNRGMVEGKWKYTGMVRWSRDPQKLLNYNLTTAQEIVSKQPKSPYLVTPKMLEGDGIKAMWDKSNAIDAPYLAYNPDPMAPGMAPQKLPPPDMPQALTAMAQLSVDMLKASDGIFDASVGARSNETSGKAIMARQREGDTATFDYQDSLNNGIMATGKILVSILPKIYDTPRGVRVLGRDGAENYVKLYQPVRDEQTGEMVMTNDLSAGKYDVSVSAGSSYSTQRAEFVEMMMSLSQSNPGILQVAGDLIMGAMDFPKSEEVAERLKIMLPPPIQQMLNKDTKQTPEVMQMQQQFEQITQQAQMQMQEIQQALQECAQENEQLKAQMANKQGELQLKAQDGQVNAQLKAEELALKQREQDLKERELSLKEQEAMINASLEQYNAETARIQAMNAPESAQDGSEARESEKGDQSTAALIAGFQAMLQPKTSIGSLTRMPDGSYQMVKQEGV
jgi:hypothetical protein